MTTATISIKESSSTTLRGLFPETRVWDATLVVAFALITAAAAQISFQPSWTPVPFTGQTFAVLLAGGVLGSRLGGSSQLLYVLLGIVGLPVYSDHAHGWKIFSGATGGYLVGFVIAAYCIGYLSERQGDRNIMNSFAQYALGTVIIYTCGAAWLAHSLNIPVAVAATEGGPTALAFGVTPFLIGDLIKAVAAGVLVPTAARFATK